MKKVKRINSQKGRVCICPCCKANAISRAFCGIHVRQARRGYLQYTIKRKPVRIKVTPLERAIYTGNTKNYLYRTWQAIRERCHSTGHETYRHYGAKGIQISLDWYISFDKFYKDIVATIGERPAPVDGERFELDRINEKLGYNISNIQWLLKRENLAKRRFDKSGKTDATPPPTKDELRNSERELYKQIDEDAPF